MERKGTTEGCDWKISTHSLDSQNQALEARSTPSPFTPHPFLTNQNIFGDVK
jgi:hypothetical protein